jgi:hypothetical protein
MSARILRRRVLGLIAAYVFALQAVLAVGPALSIRAAGLADICVPQSDSRSPATPAHHGDRLCCLAMGCQGWAGVSPHDVVVAPARHAALTRQSDGPAPAISSVAVGRPNWPRAPPV